MLEVNQGRVHNREINKETPGRRRRTYDRCGDCPPSPTDAVL